MRTTTGASKNTYGRALPLEILIQQIRGGVQAPPADSAAWPELNTIVLDICKFRDYPFGGIPSRMLSPLGSISQSVSKSSPQTLKNSAFQNYTTSYHWLNPNYVPSTVLLALRVLMHLDKDEKTSMVLHKLEKEDCYKEKS